MKIKCDDTRRARSNLEAAAKLGRQRAGLFGYIETINNNGELYVHYRSGTRIHGLTDRRKIVFEDNYIVLKNDRPIIYSLIECVILFVVIAALFLVIGEFIYGILFVHKVIFDVKAALLSVWLIGVIKVGPMHYVKKYIKEKIENNIHNML